MRNEGSLSLHDEYTEIRKMWLKAFWGFNNEDHGYVGFSKEADRDRLIEYAEGLPLFMMIYGSVSPETPHNDQSRLLGFLEIVPEKVTDTERMTPKGIQEKVAKGWENKWTFAVPIRRAWKAAYTYEIGAVAPKTYDSSMGILIAGRGKPLLEEEIENAKRLPVIPVNVFGEPRVVENSRPRPLENILRPSRGLEPKEGEFLVVRTDGDHWLYMMKASGDYSTLFGSLANELRGCALVKIGFSNDIKRRCAELNSGFPPSTTLRWELIVASQPYLSGSLAKQAEDRLKDELNKKFKSLGGEFFAGDLGDLRRAFLNLPGVAPLLPVPAKRRKETSR